jgi:hypothetical protein
MKKRAFFLLILLSGCVSGPINYLHKTGSSTAQRQAAYDQCKIEAVQLVPAQSRAVYNPGYQSPGTTYCNTVGSYTSCNTYGGVNIPGSIDTVDDNAGLRARTIERCLASKGYSVVQLPVCQKERDYQGDVQPPLSQISCATPRIQN